MDEEQKVKKVVKIVVYSLVGLFVLFVLLGTFFTVNAGEKGVVLRFGAISRVADNGIHFKFPIIESVKIMNIQIQKEQVDAEAASSDLQNVKTTIALNYNLMPDKVDALFAKIGIDYKTRIIDPAIQEAVKSSTAKYTAEELVTKRPLVRDDIKSTLSSRLQNEYIQVSELSIVNFDFSNSFNAAIEAKVTAEQNALAAKNKLEQVKFEKEQRIAQAQGEAEAIKIQAQAINSQGGADYVNLKAIEKWNGVLPAQMIPNATVPFINLK
jgi:regulator of protease activity HflC (stomatin/prohibitin superfamily)